MKRSLIFILLALTPSCLSGEVETNGPNSEKPDIGADLGQVADAAGGVDAGRNSGPDASSACGDLVIGEGELCDGNCPQSCDDQNSCTADSLSGSAATCDAVCGFEDIVACTDDDGCCPDGCDSSSDSDCSASCGDGIVDANETCDGDCPTSCDDQNACTAERLTGTAAACNVQCSVTMVTVCLDGDGCCPAGCNAMNDDDCAPQCGNQVVEPPETCDGACPDCNDQVACTTDTMTGAAGTCDVACTHAPITACVDGDGCCPTTCNSTNDDDCGAVCGNGVIEGGETCDPQAACPTCVDGNVCTTDITVGAPTTCDVVCSYVPITACTDGDGCCAPGCNANNDDDCAPTCGNNVIEPTEVCDGNCPSPASCNDQDACTADTHSGASGTCDAACNNAPITACVDADGCCPSACTYANDDDCPIVIDCRDPQTWPTGWASLEAAVFAETNARRTSNQTCNGQAFPPAPALTLNPQLQEAARCHAFDMASNNFFSHTGTGPTSPGQRITLTGYAFNTWGENIAAGGNTAVGIVNQWMNSTSGHCESIMNPTYDDLGIGYAYDAASTWKHYSVQVFGRD